VRGIAVPDETPAAPLEIAADDNVIAALFAREERERGANGFAYRDGDRFVDVTLGAFCDDVRAVAAGLAGLGIVPGSAVCLFSRTRYEFSIVDYAILAAGCHTVPIYETDSDEQIKWVASNSGAVAIVIEDLGLRKEFDQAAPSLPDVAHVFVIEDGGLDELKAAGASVTADEVERRWRGITHDQLATIVYTSGTTGLPKGCALTHGNAISEVRAVAQAAPELLQPGNSTLAFLPLAHVLARVVQWAAVSCGVQVGYATSINNLTTELKLFPPTMVVAVPRVFEKVFNGARAQAGKGLKTKLFDRAADVSIAMSAQRQAGKRSFLTRAEFAVYDKLVYSKLRAALGGKLRWAISGGAPLGTRLGNFFNGLGLDVLEGYGLTETTAAITANAPGAMRIGTVGRAVPGATVRIADDGEVLLKGPMVFSGYWRNQEATAEAIDDDGWFHSGDLGALDADGYLSITGRKKDLIITAGGKNVQPAELEDSLSSDPLVGQSIVVGDNQPFIGALISLDPEELPKWAAEHGKGEGVRADQLAAKLADDPDLRAHLQKAVDKANGSVSRAESIREFRILPQELTVDGGELTPTLKVKRKVVLEKFAAEVDSIYGGGRS
jgi:long-chain acyl-CoA synthetase